MYQTGAVDVLTLKELLGHSSVGTTQIYTHLQDAQVRAAIEANPLGAVHQPKAVSASSRLSATESDSQADTDSTSTESVENAESTGEWAGEALPEILPSLAEDFKGDSDPNSASN